MKTGILAFLLPALALADTTLDCDCNLKAKSRPADTPQSCTCFSSDHGGTAIYTGGSGTFSIGPANQDHYGHAKVYLNCPPSSFAKTGNYGSSGSSQVHCSITEATPTSQGYISCDNKAFKTHHFVINDYTCYGFHTTGQWQPLTQLETNNIQYTFTVGAEKSESETKTTEWTASTTTSVEEGLDVEGISAKGSLSTTASKSLANSDSKYWSTSTTSSWQYNFDASNAGKEVWQWKYTTTDPWGNMVTAWSESIALTSNQGQEPKCVPGYIVGTDNDSQICCSGYCLPGVSGCQEQPCPTLATNPEYSASSSSSSSSNPSAAPTSAPTDSPTSSPTTATPTDSPTSSSTTAAPTSSPTASPTKSPTDAPTEAPTDVSTAAPTGNNGRRLRGVN